RAEALASAEREAAALAAEVERDVLPSGRHAPRRNAARALGLLPVLAVLVVLRALLGVLEDLVGLAELLELLDRARLLVDVRVVLARELAVRPLDLLLRGRPRHPEHRVVVDELHGVPQIMAPRAVPRALTIRPRSRGAPRSQRGRGRSRAAPRDDGSRSRGAPRRAAPA